MNLIKYQFQQTLADSLQRQGSEGVMQCQEVATAIANESNSKGKDRQPQELVDGFDSFYQKLAKKNKNLVSQLVEQFLSINPHADPDLVRAILWTLSEKQAPFAIKWLSGQEIAQFKAKELGLPSQANKTNQDREGEALKSICQILNLVSRYYTVIICFDEIDTLNNCDEAGNKTEEIIVNLVKRLYDSIQQSAASKGICFLTVMFLDTWQEIVRAFGKSQSLIDRLVGPGKKPIQLEYLNSDSIIELVQCWLSDFYQQQNLKPENPIYPFEKSELRKLGKQKPPIRTVLSWCADNFKVIREPLPEDPLARFEFALARETNNIAADALENNSLLADALSFGFQTLQGQTLAGETSTGEILKQVTIQDIVQEVQPKSEKVWINFKIIALDGGKEARIGVAVIQQKSQFSLVAGLKRLNDYQKCQHPAPEAAGLRALKLKLADQSKFSLWELRYRQVLKFLPWDACQSQALEPSR